MFRCFLSSSLFFPRTYSSICNLFTTRMRRHSSPHTWFIQAHSSFVSQLIQTLVKKIKPWPLSLSSYSSQPQPSHLSSRNLISSTWDSQVTRRTLITRPEASPSSCPNLSIPVWASYHPSQSLQSVRVALSSVPHIRHQESRCCSFSFSGPTVWNFLPFAVRNASGLERFKSDLRTPKTFLQKYHKDIQSSIFGSILCVQLRRTWSNYWHTLLALVVAGFLTYKRLNILFVFLHFLLLMSPVWDDIESSMWHLHALMTSRNKRYDRKTSKTPAHVLKTGGHNLQVSSFESMNFQVITYKGFFFSHFFIYKLLYMYM